MRLAHGGFLNWCQALLDRFSSSSTTASSSSSLPSSSYSVSRSNTRRDGVCSPQPPCWSKLGWHSTARQAPPIGSFTWAIAECLHPPLHQAQALTSVAATRRDFPAIRSNSTTLLPCCHAYHVHWHSRPCLRLPTVPPFQLSGPKRPLTTPDSIRTRPRALCSCWLACLLCLLIPQTPSSPRC